MNNQFTILNFDEVESTNDLAFKLIKENQAHHNTIIIANSQTKGRGRQDRSWLSPPGNLYLSLILQPNDKGNSSITDYSFLAACVIGDVLQSYQIQTKYKWPNDIMLDDKKLAGILLQFQRINNVNNLVIGVGVNLTSAPPYAISLANHNIGKENFLQNFTTIFSDYQNQYQKFGFASIRERWKNNAYKIGEKIVLSNDMEGQMEGVFLDIDQSGNLLLLDDKKKIHKISAAEIL